MSLLSLFSPPTETRAEHLLVYIFKARSRREYGYGQFRIRFSPLDDDETSTILL